MRTRSILTALSLLLATPLALATPPATPAPAATAPAAASSSATAGTVGDDNVSLKDIRHFAQVFQMVRQAYVEKVSSKTLMNDAIRGMLAGLDPHSAYLDKQGLKDLDEDTTGKYAGLGIEVLPVDGELKIVSPIDGTPAKQAGIQPGDTVLEIDGKPVDPQAVGDSIDQLRGKPGSHVHLLIARKGADKPLTFDIERKVIQVPSVKVDQVAPGYAYIRISQFQEDTASELDDGLAAFIKKHGQPRGAILDLRSNPGGLVTAAVGTADTFLDGGTIVSTRGRLADANMSFSAHPGDMLHGAPLVVLVDHGTASAAEIVSGALKDHQRALIIGQRTFGKGVVQTVLPLDAEHAVKITTARYYTPNGISIQAKGITPDIALASLKVQQADHAPQLIGSESDLPNHLANEHPGKKAARTGNDGKLAERDYALSEALNVLKGLSLAQRPPAGLPAPAVQPHPDH
ncbi:S41 family peptidase [Oleiagrimonas sp. C23AA]|uniref:S41 family peptidase n=1 Tax=Oleiagrimonas sp. C23AA TaxID=2719047 RepID=UPI00142341D6|nr:S41 family peptidase [Oleiagrimonas sp. C23AA]NII12209.1 S41 family peptidase [Oleiagrimonas sp. C23AA]